MAENTKEMETRRCIYCDSHKPVGEFTLEHIFSDAMGGNIAPDLFKTDDVCSRCNSVMGMFVDGPFIRSFFYRNEQAQAVRPFVDLNDLKSWMPFNYMGRNQSMTFGENEVCEIWSGPYGEHVYHIHENDNERFDAYAGGDPIARRKDPGRAYLFLTVTEPLKYSLTIRSFMLQFKKAARYAGNFEVQQDDTEAGVVRQIPAELQAEYEMLSRKAMAGDTWNQRLTITIGVEERWLAKLARGLGYKLFGPEYLDSSHGTKMRQVQWEQDRQKRAALMRGSRLFSETSKELAGLTGLSGAHSILLLAIREDFVAVVTLPAGDMISVVVSDEPRLWADSRFDIYRHGVLYALAPQVNISIGPIAFPDFLANRQGHVQLPAIEAFEARRLTGNA
ncbi:MAG TPA: HNH endonuclease [Noviherbaspirillum sp.]|uniref:HNH endonuclease n=1 Tax=Noviherbaspirillum sp. TaxID=1926288 RepID=UPI002B4A4907|nr:HNH endonuclease [Noviherbaspirillum sp.]HJV87886.1 HNH endonuclease [Noviherbaspirillum sp.]